MKITGGTILIAVAAATPTGIALIVGGTVVGGIVALVALTAIVRFTPKRVRPVASVVRLGKHATPPAALDGSIVFVVDSKPEQVAA